jgi:two-component system, LytTR family, response regulator
VSAPLRVLVVDDEPLARRKLRRFLDGEPDARCVGECGSGEEALARLRGEAVDALFLDIQMPGLSGFELLERLDAARLPPVVFVTAFDRYAVRAFETAAADYLLKPFDRERFRKALARVRERSAARPGGLAEGELRSLLQALGEHKAPERFLIRKNAGFVSVSGDDVDWIEAQGNYVALHCGSETHLLRETLQAMEQRLERGRFARVRRNAIVNLERIAALQPWERDEHVLVLKNGVRIGVGPSHRRALEARLGADSG